MPGSSPFLMTVVLRVFDISVTSATDTQERWYCISGCVVSVSPLWWEQLKCKNWSLKFIIVSVLLCSRHWAKDLIVKHRHHLTNNFHLHSEKREEAGSNLSSTWLS